MQRTADTLLVDAKVWLLFSSAAIRKKILKVSDAETVRSAIKQVRPPFTLNTTASL